MTQAQACLLIRRNSQYRTEAFIAGLKRCGYDVIDIPPRRPSRDHVLVLWNRLSRFEGIARDYERAGARVLVAENGWIGRDAEGGKLIAFCRGHHNGAGDWTIGAPGRWEGFGVPLQPWRSNGDCIVVFDQRGIGERGVAMPSHWGRQIASHLQARTKRPVQLREHPGRHEAPEPDFTNAHAVVTWASGAAIKALAAGVPAFYGMPQWIGAAAALPIETDLEAPFLGDRLPMFERLAWAQWRVGEIASGKAFDHLLSASGKPA